MKRLLLALIILSTGISVWAQESNEQDELISTPWVLGVNIGGAYQTSDVCIKHPGFGWGLTLGKHFYPNSDFPLWFGFRGRYLNAQTYGADDKWRTNIDNNPVVNNQGLGYDTATGIYHNHKTTFNKLGAEIMIGINSLYQNHNVLLYLFGGAGIDFYQAKYDHLDPLGGRYDYRDIYDNSELVGGDVSADLDFIRDNEYETNAQGNAEGQVRFTPHIGIGLGYEFSDRFALGIEHKTTFALTDNIDGQLWNINNNSTGNDYWHYTGIKAQFYLFGNKDKPVKPNPPIDPHTGPSGQQLPPEIDIQIPGSNPYYTDSRNVYIEAEIKHVSSKNDVIFTVNGMAFRSFTFDPVSDRFTASVNIEPGTNELVISAVNEVGKDLETLTIIFEEEDIPQPPIVDITFPSTSPYEVSSASFNLAASIKFVEERAGVGFSINGTISSSFSFNPSSDQFSATVTLQPGQNVLTVTGTNEDGSDQETVIVIFKEPTPTTPPPNVTITNPMSDPITVNVPVANVSADITNVSTRSQVSATLNGVPFNSFSFVPATGKFDATLNLSPGSNTLTITATNEAGSDSESQTIIYKIPNDNPPPPPSGNPPVITIVTPASNPATVNTSGIALNATISNISSASQLSVSFNGGNTTAFNFTSATGYFNMNLNLQVGANTVVINATNNFGSDQKTVVINYLPPVQPPTVTITQPASPGQTFNLPSQIVMANVKNIDSRSGISVSFNGNSVSNFTFEPISGTLTLPVVLVNGTNNVTISASNSAGSDSKSTTLLFSKPTLPPIVDIRVPTTDPYTSAQSTVNVTANVQRVTNKASISVTVNGAVLSAFTFNAATGAVNFTANLNEGSNLIVVSASNTDGNDSDDVTVNYSAPVQPPVVTITQPSSPNQTFNEAAQVIQASVANVSSASQITVSFNGVNISSFNFNSSTGALSFPATLNIGNNTVTISATNSGGSDTKSTNLILASSEPEPTLPPPSVNISSPGSSPHSTSNPNLNISSITENVDEARDVQVVFNGQPMSNFQFNAMSGGVLSQVTLLPGENTYQISVSNEVGSDSKTLIINYNPPVEPPVVTYQTPASSPTTVTTASYTVVAIVTNVSVKSGVSVKHNGAPVSFTFNTATGQTDFTLSLVPGNNTVVVSGTNSAGRDDAQTVIIYNELKPPVVEITDPASSPKKTSVNSYSVTATVTNVTNRNNISVSVGGQSISTFNFNSSTGQLSFVANLAEGENLVQVSATNEIGSDSDSRIITWEKPNPPVVSILTPSSGSTASTASVPVEATVTYITSASQISVKVNGQSLSNFNFNSSNGIVTFSANLNPGNNQIQVTATNDHGSDSETVQVIYNAPKPPTVTITQPNSPSVTVSQQAYEVQATVTNVSDPNGVTVTVNGQSFNNFNFDPATGSVVVFLDMDPQSYQVVINATNSAGSASDAVTIIREIPPGPVVKIISPANGTTVSTNTQAVQATVTNVTGANQITVQVNGQSLSNFNFNSSNALVSFTASLSPGNNVIVVSADNGHGSDSKSVTVIYEQPLPPTVQINNPANNSSHTSSPVSVQASLQNVPDQNMITVQVNGANINNFNYQTSNGSLTFQANLNQGSNTVTVSADNGFGNDSKTINLTYTQPQPPIVTITNPSQEEVSITTTGYQVQVSIKHVPNVNDVSVTLNGANYANFNYDPASESATIFLDLDPGSTQVEVTGTNAFGSDQDMVRIIRQALPPSVSVSSPQNNATVSQANMQVQGQATNLTGANQLTATLNGNRINNISFNAANGQFSFPVTLQQGSNQIYIQANNSGGEGNKTINVTFAPPGPPTITLINPSSNSGNTTEPMIMLEASVAGVNMKNQITITLNGNPVNDFNWNAGPQTIMKDMELQPGQNTIVITATNGNGSSSETITLNMQ